MLHGGPPMPDPSMPALRRLPLSSLRAYEAAARHGSLTRAAEELHLTHGAISRHVRALEQWLDTPLLERHPRGVVPTPAGLQLQERISGAFRLLEGALQPPRRHSRTQVRITTTPSFAARWLVPRLERFAAEHEAIDLQVSTSIACVNLARERFDLGIRYGAGRWRGLVALPLIAPEEVPVCAPRLLRGSKGLRHPDDLRHHTLLHDQTHDTWRAWLQLAGADGVEADSGLVFEDRNVAFQAACAGLGVAMAPEPMARADIQSGRLVLPFALRVRTPWHYHVVFRRGREKTAAIAEVVAWLREEAGMVAGA